MIPEVYKFNMLIVNKEKRDGNYVNGSVGTHDLSVFP